MTGEPWTPEVGQAIVAAAMEELGMAQTPKDVTVHVVTEDVVETLAKLVKDQLDLDLGEMKPVKPWEPVRQIVRAPDGRMWLLDAVEGVVERQILLDEIQGWVSYEAAKPVVVGGVLTYQPPDGYTGPHWEMHNRTWAQMAKLGRCTCEGVKPEGEHYAGCCLVSIAAGAHLMSPPAS